MLKFPLRPPAVVTLKLPPDPTVRVVVFLFDPIVREPQTAAVVMVRLTAELMMASSALVGGPAQPLQVAVAQFVPPVAVQVAARTSATPRKTITREQKTSRAEERKDGIPEGWNTGMME